MQNNRIIPITIILVLVIAAGVAWSYKEKAERESSASEESASPYVTHRDRVAGFQFTYPVAWGDTNQAAGNTACPEEDTYRTADTLSVFDSEYMFEQMNLARSESFVRSGIRTYTVDPAKQNACGDEFFLMLARGEFAGEALSSIKLERVETADFLGYRNNNASRLNTEYRSQYLLFPKNYVGGPLKVIQPYLSYVPNSDTRDLAEMTGEFAGDMDSYIAGGKTSSEIRARISDFETMVETISQIGM